MTHEEETKPEGGGRIEGWIWRAALLIVGAYLIYTMILGSPGAVGKVMPGPVTDRTPAPVSLRPAPDLALKDLDGRPVRLSALYGRTVLLAFWAPWCGPCRKELSSFIRAQREFPDLSVVAVATAFENVEDVRKVAQKAGLEPGMVWLDEDNDAAGLYKVGSFPTAFIVDRFGVLRYRMSGARAWDRQDALADLRRVNAIGQDGEEPGQPATP